MCHSFVPWMCLMGLCLQQEWNQHYDTPNLKMHMFLCILIVLFCSHLLCPWRVTVYSLWQVNTKECHQVLKLIHGNVNHSDMGYCNETNVMPNILFVSLHELPHLTNMSVHNVVEFTSWKHIVSTCRVPVRSGKGIVLSKAIVLEFISSVGIMGPT